MNNEKSAIYQMLYGQRGNFECMRMSEEHHKALSDFVDKHDELRKQLKKYPDILTLFDEMMDANDKDHAIFVDEVYKEAFSFGLAMGQEVFSK